MTIHSPEIAALDIPALVSSRICHDLISPVGAIGNGVELIEVMVSDIPEMDLISDSVDSAKAKLQFFRLCFGRVANGADLGPNEVANLGNAKLVTQRISLKWDIGDTPVEREKVKLLFLLMLCMENALPLGGEVMVRRDGQHWRIHVNAKRIQADGIWALLSGQRFDGEISPAQVQFPLTLQQAGKLGLQIKTEVGENTLTISL